MSATSAVCEAAPPAMVSPDDVARAMGISRETVLAWIRNGRITRVTKIGRTIRIPRSVFDDLLAGRLAV